MINGITFDLRNVSAKDDARVREKTLSNGILHGCALTHSGKNLTVGVGHFMAAGREIEVSQAETVASDTTEANGYGRLRFVIDLSVEPSETIFTQFRWEWDYQAANTGWPALVQEDINGGGEEYEIAFAIVSFTSGNISSVVSQLPTGEITVNTAAAPALGTLAHNTEYRCTNGSITTAPTLTIAAIASTSTQFYAAVIYKSPGTTAPVVTNDSGYTAKWQGMDVSSGTFSPKSGVVYRLSIVFDGIYLNIYVSGV
jgi:hypothetical protein